MRKPFLITAYLVLTAVTTPIWAHVFKWRARNGKEDATRLPERLGQTNLPRPEGELVWLHGSSVGETMVLLRLLEELSASRPQAHFLLTSFTRAAADALAQRQLPPRVVHQYAPLDCPYPVRRFLDHWRPDMFVLSEMDLWPRLLSETHARGIPMLMLNAHVTPRRHHRRRRFARTNGWLMELFDDIHVQDTTSRTLFLELGAPEAKMQVTGLLKAASAAPPDKADIRKDLQTQIAGRPVWLAASTALVEVADIMQAQSQALRLLPDMLMIIAPRQMHEADKTEAAALAVFDENQIARRSRQEPITPRTAVYIADSLGEMGLWLRMVPVTYPGQSLPVKGSSMGGKNPFEAMSLGVMVVHGPQTENFSEAYGKLHAAGAALEVNSAEALGHAVVQAQDPAFRAPFIEGAAKVQTSIREPLEQALDSIQRKLDARA